MRTRGAGGTPAAAEEARQAGSAERPPARVLPPFSPDYSPGDGESSTVLLLEEAQRQLGTSAKPGAFPSGPHTPLRISSGDGDAETADTPLSWLYTSPSFRDPREHLVGAPSGWPAAVTSTTPGRAAPVDSGRIVLSIADIDDIESFVGQAERMGVALLQGDNPASQASAMERWRAGRGGETTRRAGPIAAGHCPQRAPLKAPAAAAQPATPASSFFLVSASQRAGTAPADGAYLPTPGPRVARAGRARVRAAAAAPEPAGTPRRRRGQHQVQHQRQRPLQRQQHVPTPQQHRQPRRRWLHLAAAAATGAPPEAVAFEGREEVVQVGDQLPATGSPHVGELRAVGTPVRPAARRPLVGVGTRASAVAAMRRQLAREPGGDVVCTGGGGSSTQHSADAGAPRGPDGSPDRRERGASFSDAASTGHGATWPWHRDRRGGSSGTSGGGSSPSPAPSNRSDGSWSVAQQGPAAPWARSDTERSTSLRASSAGKPLPAPAAAAAGAGGRVQTGSLRGAGTSVADAELPPSSPRPRPRPSSSLAVPAARGGRSRCEQDERAPAGVGGAADRNGGPRPRRAAAAAAGGAPAPPAPSWHGRGDVAIGPAAGGGRGAAYALEPGLVLRALRQRGRPASANAGLGGADLAPGGVLGPPPPPLSRAGVEARFGASTSLAQAVLLRSSAALG